MSKTKKIATAVVSIVLASSLCLGIAACGDDDSSGAYGSWDSTTESIYEADLTGVTLNLNIGHSGTTTSTSYQALGDTMIMADGVTYNSKSFKPAWNQFAEELGVSFNDVWTGKSTSGNLSNALTSSASDAWSNTDIITSDLSAVTDAVANGTRFLNLGDYLDYMPNFKAFLEANPVVEYSIVSNVSTTTGAKEIYISPYFDGNDDIERYCIARQDWVEIILDGTTSSTTTWVSASGVSSTSVKPYMTSTSALAVDITDTSTNTSTTTIYKNYPYVLSQVKTSGTDLYTAYYNIASAVYDGSTGNIVEIMNAALAKNSSATGAQLTALFRAYVKACYTTTSDATSPTSYYGQDGHNLSDLFNGADAAWDVDDLVAMLRCVITSSSDLCTTGVTAAGLFSRTSQNDRTPDLLRLAGQLYGVRGVDSRYEYTYLDADGQIQDARNDEELWDALNTMHTLTAEGLIASDAFDHTITWSGKTYLTGGNKTEGFMMYDYVQTQTATGFTVENEGYKDSTSGYLTDDYYFAPVVNPIAKWTVNRSDDTLMRFTESWRSTKTSGIAINGSVANDSAKLAACLKFIDYMYSNDGQILMTYGPMSEDEGDENYGTNGWWYNEVATDSNGAEITVESLAATYGETDGLNYDTTTGQYSINKNSGSLRANYFIYKNKVYTGTYYKGYNAPTITDALYNSFLGMGTAGVAVSNNETISGAIGSFTNYARYIIGSTLPVSNKDQCFEYQLTSKMGQKGADNVSDALVSGALKGMTVSLDTATYGNDAYWYMVVPTSLPFSSRETTAMSISDQTTLKYLTGTLKNSSNKDVHSLFIEIIKNGCSGQTYTEQDQNFTVANSASALTTSIQNQGASTRETLIQNAWARLVEWYEL